MINNKLRFNSIPIFSIVVKSIGWNLIDYRVYLQFSQATGRYKKQNISYSCIGFAGDGPAIGTTDFFIVP